MAKASLQFRCMAQGSQLVILVRVRGRRPAGFAIFAMLVAGLCRCAHETCMLSSNMSGKASPQRIQRSVACQAAQVGGAPLSESPWDILGLPPPAPGMPQTPLVEVRRAFRQEAKRAHPDVEGGSVGDFTRLVWAYDQIVTKGVAASAWVAGGTSGKNAKLASEDGFVEDWMRSNWGDAGFFTKQEASMGPWGSLGVIEAETDDDGWGGRAPLKDFFVVRHDGICAGGVHEGDMAIYRLMNVTDGRYWGLGQVVAVQGTWESFNTGMDGRIFVHPLKRNNGQEDAHSGVLQLVTDECAEIVETRVVDRFEVLKDGIHYDLDSNQFVVAKGSTSYARIVESGKVHYGECPLSDECEMHTAECIYCFEEGCDLTDE